MSAIQDNDQTRSHDDDGASVALDPVCEMEVDPAHTQHHSSFLGVAYYFCSAGCRSEFAQDPPRYTKSNASKALARHRSVAIGTIWTCPMHPQI